MFFFSGGKQVTAAHCLTNKSSIYLIFGSLNLEKSYYRVSDTEMIIHESYSSVPYFRNDIAVIQLKTALKFNAKVGKIDMVDEYFIPETGDVVSMLGFSEGIGPNRSYSFSPLRKSYSTVADFQMLYRKNATILC